MHQVTVGASIRRRGILAHLFGDEIGTVVRLEHHEVEVTFGITQMTLYDNQIVVVGQQVSLISDLREHGTRTD